MNILSIAIGRRVTSYNCTIVIRLPSCGDSSRSEVECTPCIMPHYRYILSRNRDNFPKITLMGRERTLTLSRVVCHYRRYVEQPHREHMIRVRRLRNHECATSAEYFPKAEIKRTWRIKHRGIPGRVGRYPKRSGLGAVRV